MSPFNQPRPLSAHQLFALQLELECKAIVHGNQLQHIPCANPDDVPRYLVVTDGTAYTSYVDAGLPPAVRAALVSIAAEQAFHDPQLVRAILGGDAAQLFLTYTAAAPLSAALYPAAIRLPEPNEIGCPVFGIVLDDQLVSACASVRENDRCAEAWVWTLPDAQRRGYARQVTAAWAHDLQRQGKVPFYSHAADNHPSAGVAKSLWLHHIFTAVGYPGN